MFPGLGVRKQVDDAGDDEAALLQAIDAEVLIGSVNLIVGEAEAHEEDFTAARLGELGDDGDRTAIEDAFAGLVKELFIGFGEGFDKAGAGGGANGASGSGGGVDGHLDAFGSKAFDVAGDELANFDRVLIGHDAARDLSEGFGGDDSFKAGPSIAPRDAVNLEGGAQPGAL